MAGLCPQAQPDDTGLSARELATEREDGEPTRPRAVPAEFSDEEWRLVSERHLSDSCRIDAYDSALGRMSRCTFNVPGYVSLHGHAESAIPPLLAAVDSCARYRAWPLGLPR
jgi:hypothetical protein